MVYTTNCTGTPSIDQSSTLEGEFDYIEFVMRHAYAQKFTPTSKCLESVTLKIRKVSDAYANVQICSDNNGAPSFPTGILGEFQREPSEISDTFTEINFPLKIELENLNPLWIVITSNYDPNSMDNSPLIQIASKYEDSVDKLYLKVGDGVWHYWKGKPYFKTFKQTYVLPTIKYKCINNECTEDPTGTFDNNTCGGTCTPASSNNTTTLLAIGAGVAILYLLTRKKT